MEETDELNLSPSVRSAASRFSDTEEVSAAAVVAAILELHRSDYAEGRAMDLSLDESDGSDFRPVRAWLAAVRTLLDPDRAPELHGRHVIIGLSLLEPRLRRQLERNGFLAALEGELREPLDELLTPEGRALRKPADSVPIQPDDPLERIEDDRLGRAAFARYLALRILAIPSAGSRAYSIHLSGPWGSGKSTLLNFLRAELLRRPRPAGRSEPEPGERGESLVPASGPDPTRGPEDADSEDGWQIVTFNAWQHQHVRPPWWALMDNVFHQSEHELGVRDRLSEYWWRLSSGRLAFLIGISALAWLLALLVVPQLLGGTSGGLGSLTGAARDAGAVAALLVTVWAGIQAASKPLLLGSARAAQGYVDFASDPMNAIKHRFTRLVDRLPKRLVVFIDDLDRCESAYVVELLEGIQTLFRDAPVVFVVAADRRWLDACFEEVYDGQRSVVREPGKSLGTLFLEKAFQFSTSVPGIPDQLKREYWQHLIQVGSTGTADDVEAARREAGERLAGTENEADILRIVDESRGSSFLEQRAIREEAVERLAAPEIIERTEHVLKPLAPLLEPNPRAMKRFVNAYSVNRALATLAQLDIERDQLALWTILSLRWPQLASYLEDHPEMGERIGEGDVASVDEELRPLFADGTVVEVVTGGPVRSVLDGEAMRRCAELRS